MAAAGSWDKLIEYEKLSVRGDCNNQFRCRRSMTAKGTQEIHGRPGIQDVSPVGVKIERLKSVSDARRGRFRESLKNLPSSESRL